MKRSFYMDELDVPFETLEVLAGHLMPDADPPPSSAQADVDIPADEAEVLSREGWYLLKPTAELRGYLSDGSRPDGFDVLAQVMLVDGHLYLGPMSIHVQFVASLSTAECEARLDAAGVDVVYALSFARNLYEVQTRPRSDPMQVARELHARDDVLFAAPEFLRYTPGRYAPNDPQHINQWHLPRISAPAVWGHKVPSSALAMWSKRVAGQATRITVIDSGFQPDHRDYKPVDDLSAILPANGPPFDRDMANMIDYPHGTFAAGIAAARWNNGLDGCGVAPNAPLRLIALGGFNSPEKIAKAITYAVDPSQYGGTGSPTDGTHVISCSLALTPPSNNTLELALQAATLTGRNGLGVPIFWAADNKVVPIGDPNHPPTDPNYSPNDWVVAHPLTIAVGCSTFADSHGGSAYGPELDFLAPGDSISSTVSGDMFGFDGGTSTSWAAPCAAGVAALLLSANPQLRWEEVRECMRQSCDKVGGGGVVYGPNGHNSHYGYGRINAHEAYLECRPMTFAKIELTFAQLVALASAAFFLGFWIGSRFFNG